MDIRPLGLFHPGALTLNMAVPVFVKLTVTDGAPPGFVEHQLAGGEIRRIGPHEATRDLTAAVCFHFRPEGGLRVKVSSQAPIGSGLGGSSSYGIALARATAAVCAISLENEYLVRLIQDLEARVLAAPTGCQDHWGAVTGGVLALHIEPGRDRLERLDIDLEWLSARFTLFFTGITHHSGMVNWQVFRRRMEGHPETTEALEQIAAAAGLCRSALLRGVDEDVATALCSEWAARKRLAPEVCPSELQDIEKAALAAGGLAFKACGAGGGGSVLVWHEPTRSDAVRAALRAVAPSGMLFPTGVADSGCSMKT